MVIMSHLKKCGGHTVKASRQRNNSFIDSFKKLEIMLLPMETHIFKPIGQNKATKLRLPVGLEIYIWIIYHYLLITTVAN